MSMKNYLQIISANCCHLWSVLKKTSFMNHANYVTVLLITVVD